MDYPDNYTRGRCPECQQLMLYICGSGGQPGTWYHVSTADRDNCPDGDGRYQAEPDRQTLVMVPRTTGGAVAGAQTGT